MNTRSFASKSPPWIRALISTMGTRLPLDEVIDLRFLWHEYEAAIGYKAIDPSTQHEMNNATAMDPYEDDHVLIDIRRANRVRRVLERMPQKHVMILFGVYGTLPRYPPFGQFGDLARIVEFTVAAERLSEKMALPPKDAIEKRLRMPAAKDFVGSMRTAGEKLLWQASDAYREARTCSPRR